MRRSLRLPVAVVTALVVAEAAVLLMRPREAGPAPVPVEARDYFSPAQLTRAEDFRSGQRRLYLLRLLIEGGVLVAIVARPPRGLGRRFPALARRPVLAGAAAAAALSVVLGLAPLPVRAWARERAKDVGLVTQSWTGWAGDVAKGEAIGAAIAGAGGAVLILGLRRFGPRWWAPGAGVVVAYAVVLTYVAPVVIEPLFNRFEPLPAGERRAEVLDLARRAGVDVGEVYEVDASRRTTAAGAYVAGLGATKRVVLYDNLLEDFSPEEVRFVVAHELAHQRFDDVPRGLLYLAIVAPFGMFAAARLAEAFGAPRERGASGPRAVPAVALSLALIAPAVTTVSNQLYRRVERRADAYALELTRAPRSQIAFFRRIAVKNVSDPDPPEWFHALVGTHPTTLERIGQAEAALRDGS